MGSQLKVIRDVCKSRKIHEKQASAAIEQKVRDHIGDPRGDDAFHPTVGNYGDILSLIASLIGYGGVESGDESGGKPLVEWMSILWNRKIITIAYVPLYP